MKLYQIAKFTQGAFANRLEAFSDNVETTKVKPLSLKEFNETLGLAYRISNEKMWKLLYRKKNWYHNC